MNLLATFTAIAAFAATQVAFAAIAVFTAIAAFAAITAFAATQVAFTAYAVTHTSTVISVDTLMALIWLAAQGMSRQTALRQYCIILRLLIVFQEDHYPTFY
jgi:hypothetical protein